MKYAWIKKNKRLFPITAMCRVLKVSTSGFYGSIKRQPSGQYMRHTVISKAVAKSYFESNRIYGYRKVYEDLEADNILSRNFKVDRPNHKWAADITYIPTKLGWLYLAVVMDLFSRKIIGWSMSENIDSALVQSAMQMALLHRKPSGELIHHSDRGVQYAASDFQDLLEDNNVICSMSRKGNCWDNACVESFFGSLKNEWIRSKIYDNHEDGKKDIFNYIEMFYNRKRRHKTLGYVSPVVYEEMYEVKQERAA